MDHHKSGSKALRALVPQKAATMSPSSRELDDWEPHPSKAEALVSLFHTISVSHHFRTGNCMKVLIEKSLFQSPCEAKALLSDFQDWGTPGPRISEPEATGGSCLRPQPQSPKTLEYVMLQVVTMCCCILCSETGDTSAVFISKSPVLNIPARTRTAPPELVMPI